MSTFRETLELEYDDLIVITISEQINLFGSTSQPSGPPVTAVT